MKKNNLFKAVGIVILAYILMSWIVPIIYSITGTEAQVSYQIGFVSILSVLLETFSGFGTVVVYVLLVGAFYGVLKVTGAYDKVLELLSSKASGKEKGVLISTIVGMAIISSVSGLDLGLLVVFPILISLLVKIGYDKLVALSATLGATLIGMYGATFAGTLYGINNNVLNLKTFDQFVPKLIFLVVGLLALIIFVLMYCKKKDFKFDSKKAVVKSDKNKKNKSKSAVKGSSKKALKKERKERTAVPALIIIGIVMLVFFIGTTSWEGIFGSNVFSTAHEAWTGFKIGGFEILNKLFGGVDALGAWNTPVRFQVYSMILIIAMIVLAIVYRVKVSECFEGLLHGR